MARRTISYTKRPAPPKKATRVTGSFLSPTGRVTRSVRGGGVQALVNHATRETQQIAKVTPKYKYVDGTTVTHTYTATGTTNAKGGACFRNEDGKELCQNKASKARKARKARKGTTQTSLASLERKAAKLRAKLASLGGA